MSEIQTALKTTGHIDDKRVDKVKDEMKRKYSSQDLDWIAEEFYRVFSEQEVLPLKSEIQSLLKTAAEVKEADPFHYTLLSGRASSTLLAYLIYDHLVLYLPFFRMENHYAQTMDFPVSRKTLDTWFLNCSEQYLEPLSHLLLEDLRKSNYVQLDQTFMLDLESRRDGGNKQGTIIGVNTQDHFDLPIIFYGFRDDKKIEFIPETLGEDWDGVLQIDGYPRNPEESLKINFKGKSIGCWSHARRYFHRVFVNFSEFEEANKIKDPKKRKAFIKKACKTNKAFYVINLLLYHIDSLQKIENELEENGSDDAEILKVRNTRSRYHLERIDKLSKQALSYKSLMALISKAVTYYRNHRDQLWAYIEDPKLKLSNLQVERNFKGGIHLYRNNSLFCVSRRGAILLCAALTVIKTAQANGLNVVKYLEWMLEELKNRRDPFGKIKEEDFRKVLPYHNNPEIPDNVRNIKSNYVSGIAFQKLERHHHLTAIRHKDNPLILTFVSKENKEDSKQNTDQVEEDQKQR